MAAEHRVDLKLRQIPKEVLEKKAVEQGDIRFYELAALAVDVTTGARTPSTLLIWRTLGGAPAGRWVEAGGGRGRAGEPGAASPACRGWAGREASAVRTSPDLDRPQLGRCSGRRRRC
jgi:hypothetical protein